MFNKEAEEKINETLKNNKLINDDESITVVDLDDTISFNCQRCGGCCSNREDIILNPFDVYQIAKGLNVQTHEVIAKYCKIVNGVNSGLPIVLLKADERNLCPFLSFDKTDLSEVHFNCSINDFKPHICVLHPIGVANSFNVEDKSPTEKKYFKVPTCNTQTADKEVKIRDFIKPYLDHEEENDLSSCLQVEMTKYIDIKKFKKIFIDNDEEYIDSCYPNNKNKAKLLKELPLVIREGIVRTYIGSTIACIYEFDINKDFKSQIDSKKELIKENALVMLTALKIFDADLATDLVKNNPEDMKTLEELEKDHDKFAETMNNVTNIVKEAIK